MGANEFDPATSTSGRDGSTAIATSAWAKAARETFTWSVEAPAAAGAFGAAAADVSCGASECDSAAARSWRSTATGVTTVTITASAARAGRTAR